MYVARVSPRRRGAREAPALARCSNPTMDGRRDTSSRTDHAPGDVDLPRDRLHALAPTAGQDRQDRPVGGATGTPRRRGVLVTHLPLSDRQCASRTRSRVQVGSARAGCPAPAAVGWPSAAASSSGAGLERGAFAPLHFVLRRFQHRLPPHQHLTGGHSVDDDRKVPQAPGCPELAVGRAAPSSTRLAIAMRRVALMRALSSG